MLYPQQIYVIVEVFYNFLRHKPKLLKEFLIFVIVFI